MSRHKAKKLYEDFHKYDPRSVTQAADDFAIPREATYAGPAVYVLYRSSKYDPITYARPSEPIDYIHEHEEGVDVYWCEDGEEDTPVPRSFYTTDHLICLGKCLGFAYEDEDGDNVEVECDPGIAELYSVPSGRALLVVEDKECVIAMIWGGKLGVEPRGIVG